MYYPKQIPYLLDQKFKENIEYIEYFIEEIKSCCVCVWTMKSKNIIKKTIYNHILPDACIDMVINFVDKTILFAGFSDETEPFALNQKIEYMGIRFKPGAFYTLFQIEASQVMDCMVTFNAVEKKFSLDKIFSLHKVADQIDLIKEYLIMKIKKVKDKRFIHLVDQLYRNPKEKSVEILAKDLGYNQRHLYRVFKIQYGISPKVLLNIVRLHLCLTLLLEEKKNLIDIALLCGFYDQSHFIKEIKRYTGISPIQLLENYLD